MAGSPFATLNLLPHGSVHVYVSPCPMGGALATGSTDSIPCDRTGAPAHALAGTGHQEATLRLSWGLSKEEQTEGPASCRGKETEETGGTFRRPPRPPPPPQNPQPFALYWEATILTLWGVAGRAAQPLHNVLTILSRAPKGLFPTPAFPKDVPMIKTQRMWECGDHVGSGLKMRKLEMRCAFSKMPSD